MSYLLPHLRSGWAVDQAILRHVELQLSPLLVYLFYLRINSSFNFLQRGVTCCDRSLRPRLGSHMYGDGRNSLRNRRGYQELRSYLPRRHIRGPRFQYYVRICTRYFKDTNLLQCCGILLTYKYVEASLISCHVRTASNSFVSYLDLLRLRYELYDPCTVMFFFRNRHIMIDLGTGNNNKINWALNNKQEMIDIVETVYRGARKGRGLVISPKDYSTKYKY